MNYTLKRILLAIGLLIPYWALLFNYEEYTFKVLQVMGSFYIGLLIYEVVKWLAPAPKEAK